MEKENKRQKVLLKIFPCLVDLVLDKVNQLFFGHH